MRPGRPPDLFSLLVGGGAGGLGGALFAHAGTAAVQRAFSASDLWLKGPHGPPFFLLALNAAVFYAALGAGLNPGSRARKALTAGGTAFAALALPLAVATRAFAWGEDPAARETLAWFYLVLSSYAAAAAGGLWAAGARRALAGWRGGLGAVLGGIAGYFAGLGLARLAPSLWIALTPGPMPPAGLLLDGLLSGALTGVGAHLGRAREA